MNVRYLRRGLWLLGFGCLWLPLLDDPPLATGAYVQDVSTDRAVVAMATGRQQDLRLQLKRRDGDAASVREVADDANAGLRHQFVIEELQPGSDYQYAVLGSSDDVVAEGSFTTAPDNDEAPVRFAVFGDSGNTPWWVWVQRNFLFHLPARWQWLPPEAMPSRIGDRIAAAAPDFILHVGDIVYPDGKQAHYASGFFMPFAEALANAPIYVALGNHDVTEDEGRQTLSNFYLPKGEVTGDERCYSFAWGAVRVIVLDCNFMTPDDRMHEGHPSLLHLRHELERRSEPWVVVASHFPIFSASRQRDRADMMLHVLPVLREYCVDLYFCGHDHAYQRFGQAGDDDTIQVVTGGGGKSLYAVNVHRRAAVAVSQFHWCNVTVEGLELVLRARSVDGDLLDTLVLRQSPDSERTARIRKVNPARAARIGR
ncbi:MAG: metallophosphoesterase [Planctomycetota bacterium]|nr:metallophosphoesterase [Planctomycetota bacterium]